MINSPTFIQFGVTNDTSWIGARCTYCGQHLGNCTHTDIVLERPYAESRFERELRALDEKIERMRALALAALVFWRRIARKLELAPNRKLTRVCVTGHARTASLSSAWRARGPPG